MTVNDIEKYLRATAIIDCDNESIRRKAEELTKSQQRTADKAKSLFYFVRDEIKYQPYVLSDLPEHFLASGILERGEGFCVQKAVLLVALARAVGIPARIHFAAIRNHLAPEKIRELLGTNLFAAHGYSELYIEGRWVKATPAFDLEMCQENRIIPVEFDGECNATFHSQNQDGELHIEYVQDHGHYDDFPFDEMMKIRIQSLGTGYFERMKQAIEAREEVARNKE